MRDAFGGIVNISMIVIFLVIVSGYLAFNVTYTKAFRMKNRTISIYEEYEGCQSATNKQECQKLIDEYATQIGYNAADLKSDSEYTCTLKGVCVQEVQSAVGESGKYYYRVKTAIVIDIPIINKIMSNMNVFSVTGNTRLMNVTR